MMTLESLRGAKVVRVHVLGVQLALRVDPKTGKLLYQRGSIVNVPSPICILFAK